LRTTARELYDALDQIYAYYGRHRIPPHFGEPKVWAQTRDTLDRAKSVLGGLPDA